MFIEKNCEIGPLYRNAKKFIFKFVAEMFIIKKVLETLELNNINDMLVLPLQKKLIFVTVKITNFSG